MIIERVGHPDIIAERLESGDKFNAYETTDGGWVVALGPITAFTVIARTEHPFAADYLVELLRTNAGQPPALCRAADSGEPA